MENRLSREAARARQHWRMSWVAAATTSAIICRLVQLQREEAAKGNAGVRTGKRKGASVGIAEGGGGGRREICWDSSTTPM